MKILIPLVFLCSGCWSVVRAVPTSAFPETWDQYERRSTIALGEVRELDDPAGLLAVLPFLAPASDLTEADRALLEELVRMAAGEELRPRGVTVLTTETTLQVLADNGVDPAKACESSCALAAARELKARLFVSGSVVRSEGVYLAIVRLFDSDTGRQLGAVKLEGTTLKALRDSFEVHSHAFFAHVSPAGAPILAATRD